MSRAGALLALLFALLLACGGEDAATRPSPPSPAAPEGDAASAVPSVAGPGPGPGNPLATRPLYAVPGVQAQVAADAIRAERPAEAAVLDRIARTPSAIWLGDWNPTDQVRTNARGIAAAGRFAGATPVLALYRLPARDCATYPATGPGSPDDYRAWIAEIAAGLAPGPAVVILEPGVLGNLDCLGAADTQTTYQLLGEAGAALTRSGVTVYLDAGSRATLSAAETARRLRLAGVADVRGFALNTSRFTATETVVGYGESVVRLLGTLSGFVVDTSRNGLGAPASGELCNPPGRALGTPPTTSTGHPSVDALLWIKMPGESDGTCNGGPAAGSFWVDYAIALARRAGW